jgi:amino acid adenylation domain-containing protein
MNQRFPKGMVIPRRPAESEPPLSFAQERLWFLDALGAGGAYHMPIVLKLAGRLELSALEEALDGIVARHEALRTAFPSPAGQPTAVVARSHTLPLPVVDVHPAEALLAASAEAAEPFDLARGPLVRAKLFRLAKDEHWLVISIHHIVCDGWSVVNLISEVAELYGARLGRRAARLPDLLVQYGDYALWQRQRLTGPEGNAGRAFWRQELEGIPPALELLGDRSRPTKPAGPSASVPLELPARLVAALVDLSRGEGTTLFSGLLAGWQTLLHRWTGEVDLCVGTPVAGRARPELEPLVGLFVNTLVLRGNLSDDPPFREVLQRSGETVLRAHEHEDLPFERLVAELHPEREIGRVPLVSTVLALQNLGGGVPALRGLEVSPVSLPGGESMFDLTLEVADGERGLVGALEYRSDLFEHSTAERLARQFRRLLEGAAADPDRRLSRLPLLGRRERQQILVDWNGAKSSSEARGPCVHELFAQQVRAEPERVALVVGEQRVSYGELDARAERVASRLLALGVGPETRVGLCLARSAELVVAILAVWKAGGAYVPLDPDYPPERLSFLLADCGAKVVLTQRHLLDRLPSVNARMLCFEDALEGETVARRSPADQSNAAYVIYTSGSTGKPKGVVVEHRQVARLFTATQQQFRFDENDVWTLFHSFAFDFSVWEMWGALLYGGRLVIVPWWVSRSPEAFLELIERERVTVLNQTPSAFRQLMTVALQQQPPSSLRTIIFGGEALDMPSLLPWFDAFGDERPELVNMYGITETTVHVTLRRLRRQDALAGGRSVIGRPLPDLSVYVLDPCGQPVPIGVRGELYVGGAGVARGYLDQPELTAERFLENPFGEGRMYRSGDLARWLPTGELEYLGRIDNQAKVRGFRIELGEIEAALKTHKSVREAVVLARRDSRSEPQLIAYAVLGDVVTWPELRAFLAARLPDYMLPAALVVLERLPLTAHGKVDRRALPAPEGRDTGVPFAKPETDIEKILAEVWQKVLEVDRVGRDDNFFHLGGDSLRSIEVRARARKHGIDVPLQEIFRRQTLRELAVAAGSSPDTPQPLPPFALVDPRDRSRLPSDAEDAYPLSRLQAGLHYHSEMGPDYSVYLNSLCLRRRFDLAALRDAVAAMTVRHPILRTSVDNSFQEPVQIVHRRAEIPITIEDLRGLADRKAHIAKWLDAELHRRFDWRQAPLFRFHVHLRSDDEFQLTMSDACLDGWSVGTLLTELLAHYFARLDQKAPPELPALRFGYGDFIALEKEAIASVESQKFWDDVVARGSFEPLFRRPAEGDDEPHRVRRADLPIPDDVAAGLKALANSLGVQVKHVLLAAHLKALGHLTGSIAPITGLLVNGRPEVEGGERIVAPFVNLVPFCLDLSGGTLAELCHRAFVTESALIPHRRYPMAELKKRQGGRDLFDTVFNFTHFHVYRRLRALADDLLDFTGNENTYIPLTVQANMNEDTGELGLAFDYQTSNFATDRVREIATVYERVLETMARWPEKRHERMNLLAVAEKRQVRQEDTRPVCVHEAFEALARKSPERIAVTSGKDALSYGALNARAERLAAHLSALGIVPEARVGLCLERSAELVAAILGVMKAGGAYVPLDPDYPSERLSYLIADSGVKLVLTERKLLDRLPPSDVRTLCFEDALESEPATVTRATARPENAAYVLYTSGSTGKPKGVVVEHRQLAWLFSATQGLFQFGDKDVWTLFHSFTFDFSVWEMFGALLCGGRLVVVPWSVSRSPEAFLELVERERVTVLNQTPSAFRQLMPIALDRGGFRTLRLLIFAGEALDVPGLLPWFEARGDEQPELVNMYGITETTVLVTYRRLRMEDAQLGCSSVIGQPLPGLYLYVLDPHGQPVPEGATGEIYVSGAAVARGYLSRPELTRERFVANPFNPLGGWRMYRSGDLARRLPNGELAYLGRADQQVKVRGFRIELCEIESALRAHPRVREAVVVAYKRDADETSLIGYVVLRMPQSLGELRAYLQGKLPDHMVPASLVELPALPLTRHGKVDQKALPIPGPERPDTGKPFALPRTALEEKLATVWQEVLGLDRVGRDDDFFHLGGDSLSATRLISRVRDRLKIDIPLRALFEARTLCGFAERLQHAGPRVGLEEIPCQEPGRVPLSFAQRRLWFLEQLNASAAYNIPTAIRIEGALDRGALVYALGEIARRHETLRTTFEAENGQPVQVVDSQMAFALADRDLRAAPNTLAHVLAEDARVPFDLTRGPLWRAKLFQLDHEDHVLGVTFHHIIADGWSLDVFLRELAALYTASQKGAASPLLPLRLQYSDFAAWQHRHLRLESQLAFWKRELSGLGRCDLPTDRPRPALPTYRGARVPISLDIALVRELRALSRDRKTTLFMTLLAAWQALLHRSGAGDDIAVGVPIAGRQQEELESLIGFFVNTLVLRADLSGDPTFAELLAQVRQRTLGAYANQDAPFERVVEEIAPTRDTARHPLFQTMLAFASTPRSAANLAGLHASFLEVDPSTCKFDLALSLGEDESSIGGMLEYSTDLFDASTIVRLRNRFERLLRAVTADPERRISELPLVSAQEGDRLRRFADGGPAAPAEPRCVHLLFEEQAKSRPDAIAVIAGGARLSYGELNRRSGQIAARLTASGIGRGARVAFRANRSADSVAAILGTLSAGAAYVPLDPGWPEKRVATIVAEAGATYVDPGALLAGGKDGQARGEPTLDDLAYVLYTSGSSGQPKGVAVSHRNLAHSTGARPIVYRERVESFLLASPFAFDSSVAGLFWTLCEGGTLIIPPPDFLEDLLALAQTIATERVTHWLSVPSLYAALLRYVGAHLSSLRTVIVAGEACPPELVAKHSALLPTVPLFNEYGPTEATVWCTAEELTGPTVSIGRPIPGARVEVVDRHLKAVPVGVPGEILIGGAGLAVGYVGQPEATAERFIVRGGARYYRSGDLGRFRSDGSLELLGRLDGQVKIRGVRVEPAEIEAALAEHPSVSAAAVVAVEGSLVAHVCATQSDRGELRRFLAANLPEPLVPRAWAFHRELPRTTTGKIDRQALIARGLPQSEAALPPRDETERELLGLFEELLGVRFAGIGDSFFQLGGHSLLAVELKARIEKQFGRSLPLTAIFQGATVAELAAKLRESTSAQISPLILLERGGAGAPFFFVHPVGGTILQYRALARWLRVERPFYALQSPAIDGDPLPRDVSIETLARSYLAAVRAAQPKGPYLLGGWSFGGLVAFEMARTLRHAGEEVALLALLDSHARSDPHTDPEALATLAAWELGDRQSWPQAHFTKVERIVGAHLGAVRRWSPQTYEGRTMLFAAHQPGVVHERTLGWGPLVPRLSVIEIDADHFTLLREPAVREIAERLRAALAQGPWAASASDRERTSTSTLSPMISLIGDEERRKKAFPICQKKIFMAHASVAALPQVVADAVIQFIEKSAATFEDFGEILDMLQKTRVSAARLIGCSPDEVALIGPTSLGLSLFANGLDWQQGDEVVCYLDDYPANVYPWLNLRSRGVTVRFLEPRVPGAITPDLVAAAVTSKTRLVALASCNFLTGYRIDINAIGRFLREKNVLFSLDAIQTLGAFPTTVEYVDFLSADGHKWILGPLGIGIVYVRRECFDICRPTLLGSWNVKAPGFVAQEQIEFQPTAQRYEPGAMNTIGIAGLKVAIDLVLDVGIDRIAERILSIKTRLVKGLEQLGFQILGQATGSNESGITTLSHREKNSSALFEHLDREDVICSLRQDRQGHQYLRFSPHFYNTEVEVDRVIDVLASAKPELETSGFTDSSHRRSSQAPTA